MFFTVIHYNIYVKMLFLQIVSGSPINR